jgi:hypothetical protein
MNLQNTRSSFLKQHAAMREPHSRREFQFNPTLRAIRVIEEELD